MLLSDQVPGLSTDGVSHEELEEVQGHVEHNAAHTTKAEPHRHQNANDGSGSWASQLPGTPSLSTQPLDMLGYLLATF